MLWRGRVSEGLLVEEFVRFRRDWEVWETDLEDPKDGCDAYQDCSKRGGRARKRALEIESRRHGAQVGLSKREEGRGLLG